MLAGRPGAAGSAGVVERAFRGRVRQCAGP
jgi:hypothetical protein